MDDARADETNVRVTFAEASRWFAELLTRVPASSWDASGLGVWDVRALAGHTSRALITVETYLDRPAAAVEIATPWDYYARVGAASTTPEAVAERGRAAGEALGPDPAGHVASLVDRVLARLPDDDPVIETIGGGMRLSAYLPTRTFELVVHGHDLVAATGVTPLPLSDAVLGEVATVAARLAVVSGRGLETVLGLTGRAGLPADFSVG